MNKNILKEELKNQFAKKYLSYALSTITQRALPDLRDGLKPVHRRLIYAMYLLNLGPKSQFKKSARVVGDVIGKFHPHGDQSVYDALVRLAQDFLTKYPLVYGQGNFGNIDGDNAAAMRYTEAKLTSVAESILKDIEYDTVKFKKTYDGELEEPEILPSQFPNILANGSSGIAVGMATNIPPHNITELCNGIKIINDKPNTKLNDLLKIIKGPDFPTGGVLNNNKKEIQRAYKTGKGFFEIRASYKIEELGRGLYQIVITQIPYQVNKSKLIEKIASLILEKKNKLLDNIIDESDEKIRIILRPKNRNVDPNILMESLFNQTDLSTKFFLNMNILNDKQQPRVMPLIDVLKNFLKHRYLILNKKNSYLLKKINKRLNILKGFLIVFGNINNIIKIIRNDKDPKKSLIKRYNLNNFQADAILDMKLKNLKKIEEHQIKNEFKNLSSEKNIIQKILRSKALQKKEINKEFDQISLNFGENSSFGKRRTVLDNFKQMDADEVQENLKTNEDVTIFIINGAYIKINKGNYLPTNFDELDKTCNLILCSKSSKKIILLSNFGKSYTLPIEKLVGRSQKGKQISNYLKLKDSEKIIDCFEHVENSKILLSTKMGKMFITESDNLYSNKRSGKKILNINSNDSFFGSLMLNGVSEYIAVFLNRSEDYKLIILNKKKIPNLNHGVGVNSFKNKEYSVCSLSCIEKNLVFKDIFEQEIKNFQSKSYITKRPGSGKKITSKFNLNLFRGYKKNIKIIND